MLRSLFSAALAWIALAGAAMAQAPLPRLHGGHLEVDGQPYLVLGGELANSSASSRAYMAPRWAPLAAMHLNTVLVPVSWELVEPEEGRFDFSLVDGLLADARGAGLRVVLLWFGVWKNSQSTYVPAWVKHDGRRFPRARAADGRPLDMLSPFATATAEADARAFAALMTHLRDTDARRTVLMVQVENEIGMIPDPRDHSPAALAAWARPVPAGLAHAGQPWTAYGDVGDEAFMAWHYARFVEQVAAAGKRAYPLPLYVNAALPRPGAQPGSGYPAAGPLPHLARIWQKGAPSTDLLSPDIYFPNFSEWAGRYAGLNPLFIPEAGQAGKADIPANLLHAIGGLGAIGGGPFSIDNIGTAEGRTLGELYRMLGSIAPLILERQGSSRIAGVRPPVAFDGTADIADQVVTMGDHRVTVRFVDPWTKREEQKPETHGAIVLALGENELLVAGRGVTLTFAPVSGKGATGIEAADEGSYQDGRWVPGRRLNGDQTHQGRHVRLPPDGFSMQRVRLYDYR